MVTGPERRENTLPSASGMEEDEVPRGRSPEPVTVTPAPASGRLLWKETSSCPTLPLPERGDIRGPAGKGACPAFGPAPWRLQLCFQGPSPGSSPSHTGQDEVARLERSPRLLGPCGCLRATTDHKVKFWETELLTDMATAFKTRSQGNTQDTEWGAPSRGWGLQIPGDSPRRGQPRAEPCTPNQDRPARRVPAAPSAPRAVAPAHL